MNKKIIWVMMLTIMFAISLTGCSGGDNEKDSGTTDSETVAGDSGSETEDGTGSSEEIKEVALKFGWWGSEGRHEYTKELAEQFVQDNPGVSFEFQPTSWGEYWEKLATQAAGSNIPTIMQFYIDFIPTYASNNMLLDLTPYVEDGTLDVSTMEENLLQTGYYEGELVTIPLSMSSRAIIYSTVALEEAGMEPPAIDWTWDDFKAMAKEYTEKTGNYAIDGYIDQIRQMALMIRQQGYEMYNEEGSALGFDSYEPFLEVYEFWDEMVEAGCVYTPDVNVTRNSVPADQTYIALDQSLFLYNTNTVPGFSGNEGLKLHPIPYRTVGEEKNWVVPALSLSVSAYASEDEARKAVEFVNWWLNSEEVADVQGTDRGFPASINIQNYLNQGELTPIQKDTFDYFAYLQEHSAPMPRLDPLGVYEITDTSLNILEEVLSDQITPEEAAKKAFESFNQILARTSSK